MMPQKWRGTLLYLGILGASVGVVGVRTLPVASGTSVVSTVPGPAPAPTSPQASTKPSVVAERVTGEAIRTPYGPVQAAVTFEGARIIEVTVLQAPNRDGRSIQIASRAIPTLHDEVLRSQSAQIDTVSGATYTSDGYAQSVQSAIDRHG